VFNVHYVYELPFWKNQDTTLKKILGGWQVSGVTFFQSGGLISVRTGDDRAGVGDTTAQPWDEIADPNAVTNRGFSEGRTADNILWFNNQAYRQPAPGTFGNSRRNAIRNPITQSWDIALFKNIPLGGPRRLQLRVEAFNFPNHPNLDGAQSNPTNADFGRVLGKGGNRNLQLGAKFMF
jgi:hypothetical protein